MAHDNTGLLAAYSNADLGFRACVLPYTSGEFASGKGYAVRIDDECGESLPPKVFASFEAANNYAICCAS